MLRILIILSVLFVVGCTTESQSSVSETSNSSELYTALTSAAKASRYDVVDSNDKLAIAAASVSESLAELAQIQRSVHEVKNLNLILILFKSKLDE